MSILHNTNVHFQASKCFTFVMNFCYSLLWFFPPLKKESAEKTAVLLY